MIILQIFSSIHFLTSILFLNHYRIRYPDLIVIKNKEELYFITYQVFVGLKRILKLLIVVYLKLIVISIPGN